MTQSDAHFAGWLQCPVCHAETMQYTKDTYDGPVLKMCRIWCEDCRVVQMEFKQRSTLPGHFITEGAHS